MARLYTALSVIGAVVASASCLLTSNFDGLTSTGSTSGAQGGGGPSSSSGHVTSGSMSGGGMSTNAGTGGGGGLGGSGGSTASSSQSASSAASTGTGGGGGVGAAFPSCGVLDNFNRADGSIGTNWSAVQATGYAIKSNELYANQQNGDPDPDAILWKSSFGPTQEAYFTVKQHSSDAAEIELLLKSQDGPADAEECNAIELDYQPGVIVAYYCSSSTSFVMVGSVNRTLAAGDVFGARVFPDGTLEGYVNGTKVGSWDVSPWPYNSNPGRIGLYSSGIDGTLTLDDFGGCGD